MAISSTWRPDPNSGLYFLGRRVVVVTGAGFTQIDFRTSPWFGSCAWLGLGGHTAADAVVRGVLRAVSVRYVPNSQDSDTDAASDELHYADEDPGAGGDMYVGVADGSPYTRRYQPRAERSDIWVRAVGGNIAVDIEVEFDIYTAA